MAVGVNIVSTFDSKGIDKAVKDFKKIDGAANKAGYSLRTFDKALSNSVVKLAKFGAVAAVAGGIVAKQLIASASSLQESLSKVNAVFGSSANQVIAWSETTAKALGVSQRAALEAAGTYGNLFQAFGLGAPEAQAMSIRLVELAADMASFNNVPIDDALIALRSGLSGETEPLKRFGVALNDLTLKEKARELGLIQTTKGTLPQAIKTQAAYALILEQTAIQQGDVARTSDGVAFKMKSFGAQVEDVKGQIGTALIPIFSALMSFMNDKVIPVFVEFAAILGEEGAGGAFKYLGSQVLRAIGNMGSLGNTLFALISALILVRTATIAYNATIAVMNVLNTLAKAGFLGTALGVKVLDMAVKSSQIGIIIAAITVAVVIIALLIARFKALRDAIAKIGGFFKGLFTGFKQVEAGADAAAGGLNRVNAAFEGLSRKQLKTFDTNRKFFRDSETGATKLRMELLKVDDTFSGVSDTTGKAKDKMQEFIDKLQGVTKSQRSLKDATTSVEQANDKLGDAFANTAKAQAHFNKVTRGYAADSKEVISQNRAVADAQRNLVKANISAADSVKTLQAAEEALQKLREKVSPFDVESGEIQLQKAKFDVEQANFAVLDAEKELADLRNDPKSTPQTIREAEIALAESKFGVRDAIKSVSDAEEELNKLRTDTPTLKEIADAERVVADAKLAVEDANIALADSQANLNEQQEKLNELVNGAKEGSDAYTDALKELTDAQKAERDAINDRVEAYERLADATRDLAAAEKERSEAGKGLTPKQRAKAEAEEAARIAAGLPPALSTPAIQAIPEPFEFDFSNLDFSGIQFDFSNIGGFTPFATGGIVTNPTRALIGEAGAEAVIPLDRLESGLTVNVTINAGMGTDPAKLGDEIVDVLTRYQRRNGALPLKVA
jgi:predicted  nucleic acid-binding Zn-ribbon protein